MFNPTTKLYAKELGMVSFAIALFTPFITGFLNNMLSTAGSNVSIFTVFLVLLSIILPFKFSSLSYATSQYQSSERKSLSSTSESPLALSSGEWHE